MATIKTTICDRCGREIQYVGWTALIQGFRKPYVRRFFARKLFNGNHNGYNYSDWQFELCNECTKALEEFMKNSEEASK